FEKIKSQIDFSSLIFRSMLGGKIKRPHYEACKFKGFEFVRTLSTYKGRKAKTPVMAPMPLNWANQRAARFFFH
ncbi:hypothetical protein, partial [Anaeromusa sp.]|uniref:hypothetical protein n=1 Tax=Anaeromusa sp. TaxID=1872520 RepID=UPI002607F937